jgi:peptide/nickel transport system substrate-binding protein
MESRLIRRPRQFRGGRSLAAVIAVTTLVVSLTACAGSSSGSTRTTSGTLTIGIARGFDLNPALDVGLSGNVSFAAYLAYASLVTKDPKTGKYLPGLAQSFGYVSGTNNTEYQVTLRPGLKFSDGTPVTAAAVKSWFEYADHTGAQDLETLNIKSFSAPNNMTVDIHLGAPSAAVTDLLTWSAGMVVSPKALKNPAQLAAGPPGAGPYMYDHSQTVSGTAASYTLVPNPYYWDRSQIKWSKIVIKVIQDPATMLRAIQSGQLDVAMGDPSTYQAAQQAGLHISKAAVGFTGISILDLGGTKVRALADVGVRQALNYAINRNAIVKALASGVLQPTSAMITSDAYNSALEKSYPYDPAKAKQLLAETGYPNGFTFSMVAATFGAMGGTALTQAIVQNWQAIGVNVTLTQPTTASQLGSVFLTKDSFQNDYPNLPFLTIAEGRWVKGGAINPTGFNDPVYAALLAHAATASPEQLSAIVNQMLTHVTQEAYMVPIASGALIFYSNKNVRGVQATPSLSTSWGVLDWAPAA